MVEGQVCKPNISPRGRRMRRRVGLAGVLLGVGFIGWAMATHAEWYIRLAAFLPAAAAATGYLQANRNTCIARAAEGTFEHDDMSKTKAPDDEVAASRKVAAGIKRDTLIICVAAAAFGAATALIR